MKTWLLVLITVIVTGGAVGGGTYYYLNQKSDDDLAALQTQLDALKAPTDATAVADATADWKTYTNTQVGYSIKYPTNFDSSVTDNGASFFNTGSDKTNWIVDIGKVDLTAVREIEIDGVSKKARSVTFEQFISNNLPGQGTDKVENVKKISVDSGTVYLVTYSGQTMKGDILTSYYAYYDLGNNQYLTMMLNGADNLAIFEKMLLTFKFDETLTWKTYTNTADGYSIKYPSNWFVEYSAGQDYIGEKTDGKKRLYISSSKIVPCDSACAPGPYSNALSISTSSISADKTLDNLFNDLRIGEDKTSVTIGDQAGYKGVTSCQTSPGVGCGQPSWLTIYKGKGYTFSSGLSYQTTYNTIISTFQFTK